ncbi:MAG TPA: response regulator [Gemmatimonadaceae bacterium]|nr:response regulator [Gemmatimonadaceae bacterium]
MTKIILVEQDPVLRGIMRSSLEHAGHDVVAVAKARDALRCRAAGVVADLIIADISRRGASTIDYTDALIGHAGDIPVLGIAPAVRADVVATKNDRNATFGVTDVLTKPFSVQMLRDTVGRMIRPRVSV